MTRAVVRAVVCAVVCAVVFAVVLVPAAPVSPALAAAGDPVKPEAPGTGDQAGGAPGTFPAAGSGGGGGGVTSYIVGGSPAPGAMGDVVVRIVAGDFECSGTLVADRYVLTAAHCIDDRAVVFAGSTQVSGQRSLGLASGTAHPLFDGESSLRYDVGLYRLDVPHPYAGREIPLAGYGDTWASAPGAEVTVLGWGYTTPGDRFSASSILLQGTATVLATPECTALDLDDGWFFDAPSTLCTRSETMSPCHGDSGGPLLATQGTVTVQVGVVSYGPSKGSCESYSAAASVPAVLAWLRAAMSEPRPDVTPLRVYGRDRYETAAAVAGTWPRSAEVFVATGADFPDSLAAGAAAASANAPLLLVKAGGLPLATRIALARLGPRTVYLAGGTAAVSDAVAEQIRVLTGAEVVRLGGASRYETAAALTGSAWPASTGARVWVAGGDTFADALVASTAAAVYGEPFVLVDTSGGSLGAATAAELARLDPAEIAVVGAPGTVDDQVAAALAGFAPVVAFDAPDVTQRSVDVWAGLRASAIVGLATVANFPDALAAGPWSALRPRSPLVLVPPTCVPPGAAALVERLGSTLAVLFGGPAALHPALDTLPDC